VANVQPSRLPESSPLAQLAIGTLDTLIEVRAVEYKRSESFSSLESHIIKTSMAMANLRDGGLIIIGVARQPSGLVRTGISAADLNTYDADVILSAINKYAAPAVDAVVATVEHKKEDYVVIFIEEFSATPIICAKDSAWGNAGSIYIRPRGFVETRTPRSGQELDELIDLAAEKRAARMIRQHVSLSAVVSPPQPSNAAYDREIAGLENL